MSNALARHFLGREYPKPKPGTRFRVVGPICVNGMSTWEVVSVEKGKTVGPTCFSIDEARERVEDLIKGKKIIWFGHTRLVPKRVGQD